MIWGVPCPSCVRHPHGRGQPPSSCRCRDFTLRDFTLQDFTLTALLLHRECRLGSWRGRGDVSMRLYDGGRAPNPRRVRIFFAEKGVALPELIPVDIAKKEHLTPEFTRINPMRRLPVL